MIDSTAPRPRTSSLSIDSDWLVSSIDETVHSLRNHLAHNLAAYEHIKLDLLHAGVPDTMVAGTYAAFHRSINNHVDALQNIRDSIRVQCDKLDTTKTKIDIMTLLDSRIMYLYYKAATVQPGRIHFIGVDSECIFVQCDPMRIGRVFQFLLSMATIRIPAVVNGTCASSQTRVRRVDANRYVRVHRTDEWAECKIVDEGFVLSADTMNHLRLSLNAPIVPDAAYDYTVLTLAMCKRIVEMNGGALRVTSFSASAGLCITIRLPLASAPDVVAVG